MKKKFIHEIDRRTFLKGLGGAVVALPLFDFFLNSNGIAYAQTASALPKRYLLMANGISLTKAGNYTNFLLPLQQGNGYDLRNGLMPIGKYTNLQDYVSVLTNLRLPYTYSSSTADAPVAGYKGDFHVAANRAQLTGLQTDATNVTTFYDTAKSKLGPSSDQILKAALNPNGTYVHMNYCVQPKIYLSTAGSTNKRAAQFDTNGRPMQPQASPAAAFDQLFFNQKSVDPAIEAQRQLAIDQRKSVLDLIDQGLLNSLKRELASSDKAMLSNHFEQIRELENRANSEGLTNSSAVTCVKPERPIDPPLGADYQVGTTDGQDNSAIAYSNEDARADLFIDLIHMALTCDIARHGTLRLTFGQSWMNSKAISELGMDYHELSHSGAVAQTPFLKMVQWHVDKFCRLANKLKNTTEGNGNVLDNCALLLTSEGGGGTSSDNGLGQSAHSGDNMAILVAGRAGGMVKGTHIATAQEHPSRVILTAMKAVGYLGDSFGQVTGKTTALLP